MRPTFRGIFHLLARVKVNGKEHIPAKGAYLVAMNHVSIYDPPFLAAFWPTTPEVIGAAEIWAKPGQATVVRMYGGIQVHRGQYDRQLIETMLAALQAGRPLVIAPEGGRSHFPGMRRARPGIAYLVERTGLPVIPVGVVGTTDDFFSRAIHGERPLLEMNVGQPIHFGADQLVDGEPAHPAAMRAMRQQNTDFIMYRIADLLPDEYRGVYAQPINDRETSQ